MRYKVVRESTQIKVDKKVYKTGDIFSSKEHLKNLLDKKIVREVKDGKTISK